MFLEENTDCFDWGHIVGSNTLKSCCVSPTKHQTSVCVLNLLIIQSGTDREAQLGCSCGRSFLLSDTFMQRGGYYYHCTTTKQIWTEPNIKIHTQFKRAVMREVRAAMSCCSQAARWWKRGVIWNYSQIWLGVSAGLGKGVFLSCSCCQNRMPLSWNNQVGSEGTRFLPRPQFSTSAKAAAVLKGLDKPTGILELQQELPDPK